MKKKKHHLEKYGPFYVSFLLVLFAVLWLWSVPDDKPDCTKDPADSDCVCDEWKETDKIIRGYTCPNSCRNTTIKECQINGVYSYNEEIEIIGRFAFGSCEIYGIPDRITRFENVSIRWKEKNIVNCRQCYEYEKTCISAHSKKGGKQ